MDDNCNKRLPFVSVIMPVRNEANFIGRSLGAIIDQDYPADCMEIIIADGMSTDRTREIIQSIKAKHPNILLVDNPEKIVPTGLNRALELARGDIIIRVDGHAIPATDFIRKNVEVLEDHPEAWSVGGPIVNTASTTFGKAVAAAMSHPFGVGNAHHRFPDYEGYAEGAAFPAFRRWVFGRIGKFDVRLVRNQDDEFNFRIAQAGGKIYVSPQIRYVYFVREQMSKLFWQYFQYGFWRIPVMIKHRRPTTFRQIVPPTFFILMLILFMAGLWLGQLTTALALPALYGAILFVGGLTVLPRVGFKIGFRVPLVFATLHVAYGSGIIFGVWSFLFKSGSWKHDSQMSRISR